MHPLRKLRESGKPTAAQVSELLAENIVFNSPILVRPIEGREVVAAIFAQSSATRGSGTYTAEFKLDERTTFLRWLGTMDGHKFESLEVIVDNEQGLIVERTIALRPYPALKLFRDAMYAALKDTRCLGLPNAVDVTTTGVSDRVESGIWYPMATSSAMNNEPLASGAKVDMKFEVIVIPVADVDRSKAFYSKLGWRLDADFPFDNGFRVVQFTPPGSGCSVQFGTKITAAAPGSAQGLYLIVSDVEAARKEIVARGVEVSEVFHTSKPGAQFRPESNGRVSGPDPGHRSYSSFATFSDPDGNTWLLQEITARLPGRGLGNLDVSTLTELLRETEQHHGQYEPTAPKHHWSGWYAAYIVARQDGKTPEEAAKLGKLHIEGAQ